MLLGNYNIFNNNPGRALGGATNPTIWTKGGRLVSFHFSEARVSGETEYSAIPDGYRPPYSLALSPKAGALSSHAEAVISSAPTATLAGGKPASGSTTITFTPTGTGGLIVSGSGSATITFTSTATLISVASGSGSASVTISTSALIGALAGLSGDADITISPTGTIKAVGYLSGQSTNETEFSADALARAVWEALAADFNTAGTMGQKLNGAGSAGDPWSTDIDGVYAAGTAGDYLNRVKKYVANKLTVSGSTYSVKEDDGSTEFEGGTTTTTERSPS